MRGHTPWPKHVNGSVFWTECQAEVGPAKDERRSEKRESEGKENAGPRKRNRAAKPCGFPWICGSGGSKSGLAKAWRRLKPPRLTAVAK